VIGDGRRDRLRSIYQQRVFACLARPGDSVAKLANC
jgi:hypothetical protein